MFGEFCKCPICGKPYRFYSMMVGNQSICSECRRDAKLVEGRPSTEQEKQRRSEYFNR